MVLWADVSSSAWQQGERPMHGCTGVSQYESDTAPKYLSSTNLSSRVGQLNPRWNQDSSNATLDAQFRKAMALTGTEFLESVDYLSNVCSLSLIALGHRCKAATDLSKMTLLSTIVINWS